MARRRNKRLFGFVFAWIWLGTATASAGAFHDATVTLLPAAATLSVVDSITLDTTDREAVFYLAPSFAIEQLRVNGTAVPVRRRGERYVLSLGARPSPHKISIAYHGRLDPFPKGGRPVYGQAFADTQGAYLPASAGWLPLIDPDGMFRYRLRVSVPAPYVAVAPGDILDEVRSASGYAATFEVNDPADHLVLIAGAYEIAERRHGALRLRTYFPADLAPLSVGYLDDVAGYLDLYSAWIGPYPFGAFHVVAAPLPVGLGFRNMTYIGSRVLRLPFIRKTSLGHEVLHNWWGNGVYSDIRQGNWSEGLTTFMADYTYALRQDPAAARAKRLAWLRDYAALPAARDRPVNSFTFKAHDAAQVVGYNKVAFIFHMLRQRIGDPAFDAAIRDFWTRHRFRTAGWTDLQAAFEAASGADLSAFFTQWLTRTGAPTLRLRDARRAGRKLIVDLDQTAPAYELDVTFRVDTTTGPVAEQTRIDQPTTRIRAKLDAAIRAVTIDPDFDLFRHLDPAEAPPILRDVTLAKPLLAVDLTATATARDLIARLADTRPAMTALDAAAAARAPAVVIGWPDQIDAALATLGLAWDLAAPRAATTAVAWAARTKAGRAILLIAARDETALGKLLRPLPHYGRRSWIRFEGAKAADKGTWATATGPLTHKFTPENE